jgi:hypothetical protein
MVDKVKIHIFIKIDKYYLIYKSIYNSMSNLLNFLKNKISFGKGIVKVLYSNNINNQNIIYKEMIKWECNTTSLIYPYGNFSTINYSLISKEIKPFQIISNNNILKIDNINNKSINNENIDIFYFGKKVENNNTITYEIKDDSKVFYLVYNCKNTKKIIFYLL